CLYGVVPARIYDDNQRFARRDISIVAWPAYQCDVITPWKGGKVIITLQPINDLMGGGIEHIIAECAYDLGLVGYHFRQHTCLPRVVTLTEHCVSFRILIRRSGGVTRR